MKKITILIADNHRLFMQSWSIFLDSDPRFTVVGEANCGQETIDLTRSLAPEIVLMDMNIPGIDVLETAKTIFVQSPKTKIICVSPYTHSLYAKKLLKAGAMGYITKYSTRGEFLSAIIEVYKGNKYICKEIKDNQDEEKNRINSLTKKEMELIWLVKTGFSSKEMAEKLSLSIKTIEVHRYNILKKLNLKNRASLVNFINCYYR
jgi:DNA-binding NarL/FixJ family response regulator